jgi:hypothetical protein
MCRHTLATKGSQRTPVRFSRRSRLSSSTFARSPKWILSENQATTNAQNIDRKSSGRSCNHTANESYYCLSRSSTTMSSIRESSDDKRIAPGVSRATIHANRSQPTRAFHQEPHGPLMTKSTDSRSDDAAGSLSGMLKADRFMGDFHTLHLSAVCRYIAIRRIAPRLRACPENLNAVPRHAPVPSTEMPQGRSAASTNKTRIASVL